MASYHMYSEDCAENKDRPLGMSYKISLEVDVCQQKAGAKVIPIFKKGGMEVTLNYRPASLTSVVCKLLEKAIRKQADDSG